MNRDVVLSFDEARNVRNYEKAKRQAQANGGRLLVADKLEPRPPRLGLSYDRATETNLLAIPGDTIVTLQDFQRAKERAAKSNARLIILD